MLVASGCQAPKSFQTSDSDQVRDLESLQRKRFQTFQLRSYPVLRGGARLQRDAAEAPLGAQSPAGRLGWQMEMPVVLRRVDPPKDGTYK